MHAACIGTAYISAMWYHWYKQWTSLELCDQYCSLLTLSGHVLHTTLIFLELKSYKGS